VADTFLSNISTPQGHLLVLLVRENDGEKCRTPRINEVLRLILLIDKGNPKKESGQISEFLDMSAQVELAGVFAALTVP
jgi:hypothetical protein